jgi:hypothetical protein
MSGSRDQEQKMMQPLGASATPDKGRDRRDVVQVTVQGRSLEVLRIPGVDQQAPELLFLHEGLGSVSHGKDFPARVAATTGCPVTVYSRYGSGNSDVLTEPRPVTYMHDEALRTARSSRATAHRETQS